jgi:hypothetical protein
MMLDSMKELFSPGGSVPVSQDGVPRTTAEVLDNNRRDHSTNPGLPILDCVQAS